LKPESVSTKQERIAELARMNPVMAFTSLNQYLDEIKSNVVFGKFGLIRRQAVAEPVCCRSPVVRL
jgi:hypothetical protein